jgi:uncharacterized iron-regulated membrane protein
MKRGFRQSMAWLHAWTGLIAGWVLYFVFMTGTIGYFYVEIDRWMRPELPLAVRGLSIPQMVEIADRCLRREAPRAASWSVQIPAGRDAAFAIAWDIRDGRRQQRHQLVYDEEMRRFREPHVRETGGGFELYRLHWRLHYVPWEAAYLAVGVSAMFMLVALITGVVTHKKLLVELFTFRPGLGPRSWLDAHNAAGVLALPFFLMITCSGLVFVVTDEYLPPAAQALYDGRQQAVDFEDIHQQPPARDAIPMLPLGHFLEEARRYWGSGAVWSSLDVVAPGEADAEVRLRRAADDTVLRDGDEQLHFRATDGRLIRQVSPGRSMARRTLSVLYGLHEARFAGPFLRWLYFLSGLLGCGMVATGLVLWTAKRRARSLKTGSWGAGHRLVDALNIGTIAGLPVGVAVYFWANRLLPAAWPDRAAWEMHGLFIAWGLMLAYPAVRPPGRAWIEELSIGATAFVLLPVVNALTTNRHLGVTIPAGDWGLAGVDLTALAFGLGLAAAALNARRLDLSPSVQHI